MRFVGRAVELGVLAAHARAVVAEERLRVVLLVAEAGMGASRLLEEFGRQMSSPPGDARRAREGMRYLRVAPPRATGAPPLWPWRRVLTELSAPTSDVDDVWSAEAALSAAFAAAGPVVVALDDLHRADEPTLTLVQEFADQAPAAAVLVVAVVRPELAEAMPTGPAAHRLWLPGLAADEVAQLLAELRPVPVPEALAAQLRRRTDGSPSLLTAVAGQLADGDDGRRRTALRWPETATAPIEERLTAAGPAVRDVLGIASVVGREFDVSIVETISGAGALPALDAAIAAGLVRRVGDRVLRFDSALTRELCYDGLGLAAAAELHEAVAEALLTVGARVGERAPTVAELAHHLVAAAVQGGADRLDRAVAAAVAAARAADRPAEAVESFAVAVELASRAQWSPGQLGRLLVAYGSALHQAGVRDQAREAFSAAVRLGRQSGDAGLLAEAALAYGPREGGGATAEETDRARATALTEALALLNGAPNASVSTVARLRARLALESTGPAAQALAAQAWEAARDCADPRAVAEALLAQPDPDPDQLRQALREASALGDATLEARAHRALAAVLLAHGEIGAADRHLAEVPTAPAVVAHRLVLAGRWNAAAEALPARPSDLEGLAALAGLRLLHGDPGDLGDVLRTVPGRTQLWTGAVAAWVARRNGDDRLAAALVDELAGQPLDPWAIAFLAAAEPGPDAARGLGARLSAYHGKWIVAGPATASAGPTDLVLASLELAAGEPKRAAARLETAARQVGQTPWVAWLRYARVRWLAQRGEAALAQEVKAARTAAAERGLAGLAAQIDRFEQPDGPALTRREQEVLELAAAGASAKEIAERLVIGERTVETHLANIYRKLGVRSRVELVAHLRDGRGGM